MTDEAQIAAEVAETARRAFGEARHFVGHQNTRAERSIAEATQALEAAERNAHAAAEAQGADRQRRAADAIQAAADAIRHSYEAVGPTYSVNGDKKDEWKECRSTIDRFDKLLVDLRKTGFGFVTLIVGGAAAFLLDTSSLGLRAGLFCMLALLIVTLYLVDRVHQVWLDAIVNRANCLERQLNFEVTRRLSDVFHSGEATILGFWMYVVLLAVTCFIFWIAIPLSSEPVFGGHRMTIYAAFLVGLASMIITVKWSYFGRMRAEPRRPILTAVLICAIVIGLILLGHS